MNYESPQGHVVLILVGGGGCGGDYAYFVGAGLVECGGTEHVLRRMTISCHDTLGPGWSPVFSPSFERGVRFVSSELRMLLRW